MTKAGRPRHQRAADDLDGVSPSQQHRDRQQHVRGQAATAPGSPGPQRADPTHTARSRPAPRREDPLTARAIELPTRQPLSLASVMGPPEPRESLPWSWDHLLPVMGPPRRVLTWSFLGRLFDLHVLLVGRGGHRGVPGGRCGRDSRSAPRLAGRGWVTHDRRTVRGVDRKTARRYVQAAQTAGLVRDAGPGALSDELIGAVVEQVRPSRPNGHGAAWAALTARRAEITGWVKDGKTLVKIGELLARSGTSVPYRTLHRFATAECGFRVRGTTLRVLDGDPGVECQIDFASMGFITDPTGRRCKVHALILTAVLSRHMFVHLTHGQRLAEVIAGCEAAWTHFGGVFKVLIPDNLKPVVIDADPVNPRLSVGWLDYSQHAGFVTDPARVRSPQDKPRVERAVQYVRGNFFDGENFSVAGRRAAGGDQVVAAVGGDAGARHDRRPPALGGVHRAGGTCPAAGPTSVRRSAVPVGQGAP